MADEKKSIPDLIRESWANDDPTGWFEKLYARAESGEGVVPWAMMTPNPQVLEWAKNANLSGGGKRALVVGCGLGDDALGLQAMGFAVTAFDVSATAIKQCQARFPDSKVDFQVHNLFKTPDEWAERFDFVLESRTIQSLPYQYHEQAITQIASYVAKDGQALILCHGRDPAQETHGIPWALSRKELAHFDQSGLTEQSFEDVGDDNLRRFRVVYKRNKHE